MEQAFLHKYSLTIGRNRELIEQIIPLYTSGDYVTKRSAPNKDGTIDNNFPLNPIYPNAYRDFVTIPPQSLTITDLQMEARISQNKTNNSQANQNSEIIVYNLNSANRRFVKTGNSVILKAGYSGDNDLPTIYVGQIVKVEHEREGELTKTKIIAQAAAISNQFKVNKSYPPGTKLGEVLYDLSKAVNYTGIPSGEVPGSPVASDPLSVSSGNEYIFNFGKSINGNLMDQLGKLTEEHNMRTYVTNGKLYIESKNKGAYAKVAKIGREHVKGSIKQEEDNTGTLQPQEGIVSGLKLNLFLNGRVALDTTLRVTYGDYMGDYMVESISHTLNYEDGPWDTEVTCRPFTATPE